MTPRKQMFLSGAIVLAAAAVVGVYALVAGDDDETPMSVAQDAATAHEGMLMLDSEEARRIGVAFTVVRSAPLRTRISTVGNVTYDETRITTVDPRVEGWVEQLHVDFTGAAVRRGQPLLSLYSPMVVSAQEELILARRLLDNAEPGGRAALNAAELLAAARRRLGFWDVSAEEIQRIERSGTPQRTVMLAAPASGIVVEKNVVAGSRVMPGMPLYRIADLARVWVEGEVFERDLGAVRVGQAATVTVEAYPGEVFTGRVAYVYPNVTVETRSGRVRIELENPGMRLMPGMYARVQVEGSVDRPALLIPRDAVHVTGERAVVFVRDSMGGLQSRSITTGAIAGNDVEVLAGLREGEEVVSSAAFLVDAEASMGDGASSMPGMEM